MKKLLLLAGVLATAGVGALSSASAQSEVVRFDTPLGNIDVLLLPEHAPNTVTNFLGYVNRGDYDGSFIHRSIPGFIIQGGGYKYNDTGGPTTITQQAAVANEFFYSNVRGTMAMAKLGTDPNSATDQWFFNLADNSSNLDNQNGGFTVFGRVLNSQGLAVMDAIAALQVYDLSGGNANSPFTNVPLINYSSGTVTTQNLVNVTSITVQPASDYFFSGEVALDNGVYFLKLPDGNPFGYYSYLDDPRYIYHFDLGYEYVFDAGDGVGGIYLYDFQSGHFFYTSPTFPFPYLYDFSLQAFLYYFPDPNHPGHYNTGGVRYFDNLKTGEIITE